jgi:uncharacterized protein YegP (UPF0339 family)
MKLKIKFPLRRKTFEILKSKNKQWYFVLKAENGEVVLTSETYKSKQACIDTIKLIRWNSLFAKTIDLT